MMWYDFGDIMFLELYIYIAEIIFSSYNCMDKSIV